MLRPKDLQDFLEKTNKLFPEMQNMFIANPDGSLIVSTNSNTDKKNLTSCLSFLWNDFYEIGKIKLGTEEQPVCLQTQIIHHENGQVIMTSLCELFLFGMESDSNQKVGLMIQKMEIVKNFLEQQFKKIIEQMKI